MKLELMDQKKEKEKGRREGREIIVRGEARAGHARGGGISESLHLYISLSRDGVTWREICQVGPTNFRARSHQKGREERVDKVIFYFT